MHRSTSHQSGPHCTRRHGRPVTWPLWGASPQPLSLCLRPCPFPFPSPCSPLPDRSPKHPCCGPQPQHRAVWPQCSQPQCAGRLGGVVQAGDPAPATASPCGRQASQLQPQPSWAKAECQELGTKHGWGHTRLFGEAPSAHLRYMPPMQGTCTNTRTKKDSPCPRDFAI